MLTRITHQRLKEDRLYSLFKDALAVTPSRHPLVGQCYSGTVEDFRRGQISLTSRCPQDWRDMWDMVGMPMPPAALPDSCMFNFVISSAEGQDCAYNVKDAFLKASGLALTLHCHQTPAAGPAHKAGYHFMILPAVPTLSARYETILENKAPKL